MEKDKIDPMEDLSKSGTYFEVEKGCFESAESTKNELKAESRKCAQGEDVDNKNNEVNEKGKDFLNIDRSLLHCKLLYFCYHSALGALWPYLPLYFKQLFLTPRQVGTIVASRTFVQFLCVPFWTSVADRYKRHKLILLLAVFAWLVSTMALLIVPAEQPKACFKMGLKRAAEVEDFEDAWFQFEIHDILAFKGEKKEAKRDENDSFVARGTGSIAARGDRDISAFRETNMETKGIKRDVSLFRRRDRVKRSKNNFSIPTDGSKRNTELKNKMSERLFPSFGKRDRKKAGKANVSIFKDVTNTHQHNNRDASAFSAVYREAKDPQRDVNSKLKIYSANSSNFTPKYAAYDPDQHVLDSSKLYLLLLFITIIGIMISAPSLILVDICTLQKLKDKPHYYGRQALWGSLGFGIFAFSVGTSVNFFHTINMCTKKLDFNYVPCFYVFAFFMTITLLVGSQLSYEYDSENSERPSFIKGLKSIHDVHLFSLLIVTFYCGMGSGFISTFLFWHLREMGGMQALMALVTLLNSSAEVLFYLLSDRIIHCIGHFRVIYIGLLCFAIRFFYYSFLRAPWLVLPIEITHGMTSAAIRSALVSYLGKDPKCGSVLQGVFNGVHSGLGFSIGGLTGGIMVHEFGHSTTFLIFGEVSLVMMFSFILVNNVWPNNEYDEISTKDSDLCKTKDSIISESLAISATKDLTGIRAKDFNPVSDAVERKVTYMDQYKHIQTNR